MKIAFIVTALTIGGAEMMLLKILEHIDRQRFEPYVISLQTSGEVGPKIEALGIPVIALNLKPHLPNPFRFFSLTRYLREINPDIVQTWMYHADLIGGIAARLVSCKQVVWGVRNSNLDPRLNKRSTLGVVKTCAMLSSKVPDKILTCSRQAMEIHVSEGYVAKKMHVIPNGFDMSRFQADVNSRISLRSELGLSDDAPLVGLMARYDPQKNHQGFIKAAALINQQMPSVHFVLAGNGIDQSNSALTESILAHNLASYVHLLGRRDDMPRLMAALDVLASSSDGEAFPNVIGEAMASEIPCVVTDAGDSAEIVGDFGRVVRIGDMQDLADKVLELLSLPQYLRSDLGKKARNRVKSKYEIGNIVNSYMDFYERLLVL